jgi:hypothetical protein
VAAQHYRRARPDTLEHCILTGPPVEVDLACQVLGSEPKSLDPARGKKGGPQVAPGLLNPCVLLRPIPPLKFFPPSRRLIVLPTDRVGVDVCRNPDGRMP